MEKPSGDPATVSGPRVPDTDAEPWTLHAYATRDGVADFAPVPASKRRAWMDATPEAFARRCLPLSVANQAGWVFRSPFDIAVRWDGTDHKGCLTIELGDPEHPLAKLVSDHFGSGIVTFSIPYVFRTPPGVALAVRGAPNFFVDGIHPLEGLVETDWMTATFTMNWRITRPRKWVRFAEDDPICFLQPISLGLLESARPRISPTAAAPEIDTEYRRWSQSRSSFNETNDDPRAWQREYFKGHNTVGEPAPQHRTGLRITAFQPNESKPVPVTDTRRATPLDRLKIVDGVTVSQRNEELLIIRDGRSYRVDHGTVLIMQACTGTATVDAIAATIADTLDLPLPPVDKVTATLRQLRDAGFVTSASAAHRSNSNSSE